MPTLSLLLSSLSLAVCVSCAGAPPPARSSPSASPKAANATPKAANAAPTPLFTKRCPTSLVQVQRLALADQAELSTLELCDDGTWIRTVKGKVTASGSITADKLADINAAFASTTKTDYECEEAMLDYVDTSSMKISGPGRTFGFVRCPETLEEDRINKLLGEIPFK